MLINVKGQIDPSHFDIVLAESLVDRNGDFYDLTLKKNFDELVKDEAYVADYQVEIDYIPASENWFERHIKRITYFTAWTKSSIIYCDDGPFTQDRLLRSLPRNPT